MANPDVNEHLAQIFADALASRLAVPPELADHYRRACVKAGGPVDPQAWIADLATTLRRHVWDDIPASDINDGARDAFLWDAAKWADALGSSLAERHHERGIANRRWMPKQAEPMAVASVLSDEEGRKFAMMKIADRLRDRFVLAPGADWEESGWAKLIPH